MQPEGRGGLPCAPVPAVRSRNMSAVPPDPAGDRFAYHADPSTSEDGHEIWGHQGTASAEGGVGEPTKLRKAVPWDNLIKGTAPAKLLELVGAGDPFRLRSRSSRRLHEMAVFLDAGQLYSRLIARVAYECARLKTRPKPGEVSPWLTDLIDRSIHELRNEDSEMVRRGDLAYEQWDPRYLFVTETLGLPAETSRARCVAFNGLAREVRRAFAAIAIDGLTIEEATQRDLISTEKLHTHVLLASTTLLGDLKLPDDPTDGGTLS
ncbi:MAG: DNA-directed RNA polymerase specialized sigma24 family protein [Chlamydiales bacterium]|jgi:DNA-directed RNA polymerase specialized sigma24 family protein